MAPTLYIYDNNTLKFLKERLVNYRFFSIAYFLHRWDTIPELEEIDKTQYEKSVVDITNLVKDGNYFRVFTERYLCTLLEDIADLHFCLHYSSLEPFIERFPYMFDEKDINLDFHNDANEKNQNRDEIALGVPLTLYTYTNPVAAKKLYQKGLLISLSDLVEECEGVVFRYNIDRISSIIQKHEVEYIDLSSVIRTIKVRHDLVFQFEILIHRISAAKEIKYCAESTLTSEVVALFPFSFFKELYMDDGDAKNEMEGEETKDIGEVTSLAKKSAKSSEVIMRLRMISNTIY